MVRPTEETRVLQGRHAAAWHPLIVVVALGHSEFPRLGQREERNPTSHLEQRDENGETEPELRSAYDAGRLVPAINRDGDCGRPGHKGGNKREKERDVVPEDSLLFQFGELAFLLSGLQHAGQMCWPFRSRSQSAHRKRPHDAQGIAARFCG